jgi:hypothetical protein
MRGIVLAFATVLVAGAVRGDVVYNNLASTNATGFSFGAHEAYAQKFNSGAGGQIDNIKLNVTLQPIAVNGCESTSALIV